MDNSIFAHIQETRIPKFNPLIAEGLAVEHLRNIEKYVDRIMHCAAAGFPKDLVYHGLERCSPTDAYNDITRKKNNRRTYEIAESNVYMVKLMFSFGKEKLPPRYMYLPYVNSGGLMKIRGSLYAISPVIRDTAISNATNSLFLPLTRTKLTFERTIQHFYINGKQINEYVIWSTIYVRSQASVKNQGKPTMRARSTLPHYLFCKYGLVRTFAEFGHANIEVGTANTITPDTHPESDWMVCASTNLKPWGLTGKTVYTGSDIRIAIRKTEWSPMVAGLVAGFFYVVDFFPDRVLPEFIFGLGHEDITVEDETRLWKVLMGHVIFSNEDSEGKLAENIETHMGSLDEYIDIMAKETLASDEVYVDNFYQLMAHIIETFSERIMKSGDSVGSMYGKRLTVLSYVALPITKAAFRLMFKLQSTNKPVLTKDDITNAMNKFLKTELIMSINFEHGEVKPIASSGDNKLFNITQAIVPQTNSTGGNGTKTKASLLDPSKFLHSSLAEVASFLFLQKAEPFGRTRINPTLQIDEHGSILRDPNKLNLIDSVQEKIKR